MRISTIFSAAWLASSPWSSSSAERSVAASRSALRGVGPGDRRLDAVLVDELGPLDERVDHLVLGHDGDVAALDEQVAALVAGGDAEVGLAGLAGPLTTQPITATCSGISRSPNASIARLATSITSISARPHDGQAIRSTFLRSRRPERLEQLPAGAGLLDRIGGERVADRVADALEQQRGDAGGGLDAARRAAGRPR